MDRLTLHIEYLLLRHDCVVIPGFGAFINVRHSAVADMQSGMFHPMCNEVRFNAALDHDDGLLASSFARKERVTFAEGREMVTASAAQLRRVLAFDREVSLGRLGRLQLDEYDNVSFQPFASPDVMSSMLGWLPAHISISEKNAVETPGDHVIKTLTNDVRKPETSERSVRHFDTDRNYYIPVNKILARSAASFILIAVIAISVILPFRLNFNEDQASVVPVKAITEAMTPAQSGYKETVRIKPSETEVAAESETAEAVKPENWHLIVATFHSAAEAENFIAANSDSGYTLTTVASRKLYRVSAENASEKQPLLDRLNSDAFKKTFPQAWIFNSDSK